MRVELFSAEDSMKLREKFISNFTDKSQALRLYPHPSGIYCVAHIWEHMSDYTVIRSTDSIQKIAEHGHVYLMWDMVKVSDDHRLDIPFPKDRIAKVGGAELAVYLTEHFPPPMGCYVFNDTFKWYISVTNEYDYVMIDGKQIYDCICFSKV